MTDYDPEEVRQELEPYIEKLETALQMVLLFYKASWLEPHEVVYWGQITGNSAVTTKVLCDHIRSILGESPENSDPADS